MSMLKLFFYIINLIFVAFYLYPGSILGRIIYGDFKKQPQLTNDFNFSFLDFSSNHIYAFAIISCLGLIVFYKNNFKQITIYLFSISLILEILHIIIPYRSFQFSDLNGNFLGVIIIYIIFYIYSYAKKIFN